MHTGLRLLSIAAFAGWLMGAEGCPLQGQDPAAGASASASASGPALDVGGSDGAVWEVTLEDQLLLTLRAGDQVASKQTDERRAPLLLLGEPIDAASFCWRPDIACPQHVLASETLVAQPDASGTVLLTFNRRGPLATLQTNALVGRIDGKELSIGLPTEPADAAICALQAPSAILATAFAGPVDETDPASAPATGDDEPNSGGLANQLEGRITVSYDGMCLAVGGSAALAPGSRLELSARFSARRR